MSPGACGPSSFISLRWTHQGFQPLRGKRANK